MAFNFFSRNCRKRDSQAKQKPQVSELEKDKKEKKNSAKLREDHQEPICSVCNDGISTSYISIKGNNYHRDCFKCVACNEVFPFHGTFVRKDLGDGIEVPMHRECHDEMLKKMCTFCFERTVAYSKHVFFSDEIVCTKHITGSIRRCDACTRYEPIESVFFDLCDGGRCLCPSCYSTVVLNSSDLMILWNKVLDFFDYKLHLKVWDALRSVPVASVGGETLNESSPLVLGTDERLNGEVSEMQRCRGMCLTEYSGCLEVTAILCLTGLPSDLTGCILAHEATHAWFRLHPEFDSDIPIPPFVEEGLCQLVAYLFLSEGLPTPSKVSTDGGPSEEKLRQFFRFSIESDICPVYGLGFRRASEAYAEIGIEPLLAHVLRYRGFPQL